MVTKRRMDASELRVLAARLELERSPLLCAQLAHALGYRMRKKSGGIWLDKPGSILMGVYFSIDALIEDLVRDARRLVGRL